MANFKVEGTVVEVYEEKRGTTANGKEWALQDFVIEEDLKGVQQYADKLLVTVDLAKVPAPAKGDKINAHCEVKATPKKTGDGYWNNVRCWEWRLVNEEVNEGKVQVVAQQVQVYDNREDESGDLPF